MSATKVTLRKRTLPSGKITLYLDFWPPIKHKDSDHQTRREYLGIYLKKSPKTQQDRKENAEKVRIAEGIRSQREISLLKDKFGFADKATAKMDFLAWGRVQVDRC